MGWSADLDAFVPIYAHHRGGQLFEHLGMIPCGGGAASATFSLFAPFFCVKTVPIIHIDPQRSVTHDVTPHGRGYVVNLLIKKKLHARNRHAEFPEGNASGFFIGEARVCSKNDDVAEAFHASIIKFGP